MEDKRGPSLTGRESPQSVSMEHREKHLDRLDELIPDGRMEHWGIELVVGLSQNLRGQRRPSRTG